MDAKTRNRLVLALVAQAVVVVSTAASLVHFFTAGGEGNMAVAGWKCFRYFTVDSNVLAALGCVVCMWFEVRAIRRAKASETAGQSGNANAIEPVLPHGALIFMYVGTVAVTVTFMVVMCFLGPIYGYGYLFAGYNLPLHGSSPILCILTFMLLLRGKVRLPEALWCEVPVLAYGAVYLVMAILLGPDTAGWPDFYLFNATGMWPVAYIVIGVATFVFAAIERLPHRR